MKVMQSDTFRCRVLLSILALIQIGCADIFCQTFRANGVVSLTHPHLAKGPDISLPFVAYVHENKWLIRTTDQATNSPFDYFEAGYNSTNRITFSTLKANPIFSNAITSNVRIENSLAPEGAPSLIAPVWLGLASAHYFLKLTNSTIVPFWQLPPRSRVQHYAPTAQWKLATTSPPMLEGGAFYETSGWLSGAYKEGFLRQRYSVIAWTNVGELHLPLEWHLQEFAPKVKNEAGKTIVTGKSKDDTESKTRLIVKVSSYEIGVRLVRYDPTPSDRSLIEDRRFAQASPAVPVIHYSLKGSQYPSTNSRTPMRLYTAAANAKRIKESDVGWTWARGVTITSLILITLLFAVALRHYGRKNNKQDENK